jgi:hypothetical protein
MGGVRPGPAWTAATQLQERGAPGPTGWMVGGWGPEDWQGSPRSPLGRCRCGAGGRRAGRAGSGHCSADWGTRPGPAVQPARRVSCARTCCGASLLTSAIAASDLPQMTQRTPLGPPRPRPRLRQRRALPAMGPHADNQPRPRLLLLSTLSLPPPIPLPPSPPLPPSLLLPLPLPLLPPPPVPPPPASPQPAAQASARRRATPAGPSSFKSNMTSSNGPGGPREHTSAAASRSGSGRAPLGQARPRR